MHGLLFMSYAEIKKSVNSDFLRKPLDKMFGLTRLESATVSTPATEEGHKNFTEILTISNVSGILIFYASTYDTSYCDFPEKQEWIPVYSGSASTAKYILILNKEMTYTFKMKSSRSGNPQSGFNYNSNRFTYTIYQFGGGV